MSFVFIGFSIGKKGSEKENPIKRKDILDDRVLP
jgi:hypothetical protein